LTGTVSRLGRLSTASIAALGAFAIVLSSSSVPAVAGEPATDVVPAATVASVDPSIAAAPSDTSSPAVDPSVPIADIDPAVAPAVIAPDPTADPSAASSASVSSAAPAAAVTAAVAAPKPVVTRIAAATAVVRAAESHIGARYRHGATGPRAFDCSGLVYRSFAQVGLARKIHDFHSARALYAYFRRHHLASRHDPQVGDLVIWGHGAHVGIYIGHGKAISALVRGVRIHAVSAVLSGFTAYLHMHLAGLTVPVRHATSSHHAAPVAAHGVRFATTTAAIRSTAGTSHRRIAVVHRGARLTVLGSRVVSHRRWYHVRLSNGHTGWIAGWLTRA
jgi:cell wall-associated NlpC family hydrolase